MAELESGAIAPSFTLLDDSGTEVSLSDFAGQRVIVYFYPAAMTPGCSREAADFNAVAADLSSSGYRIIGISPDLPERQARFKQKEGLTFPLLSDPDKAVANQWGAWGSKVLYGKRIEGIIRSTFVVEVDADGAGQVLYAHYNVRAKGHVERICAELRADGDKAGD